MPCVSFDFIKFVSSSKPCFLTTLHFCQLSHVNCFREYPPVKRMPSSWTSLHTFLTNECHEQNTKYKSLRKIVLFKKSTHLPFSSVLQPFDSGMVPVNFMYIVNQIYFIFLIVLLFCLYPPR